MKSSISNSSFFQSTDGGQTFRSVGWGGDNHDIWWDPKDADRFVITHDAGMSITEQHGRSIQRVSLPIGQIYHVFVDNQVPYNVYANMQDDGTMRGPAFAPEGAGAGYNGSGNVWDHGLGGCESGFTVPDLVDPEHRLVELLRQQAHALRPSLEGRAVGRAGDDHARRAAAGRQIPLSLDRAARHRSVRPQHRRTTAAR